MKENQKLNLLSNSGSLFDFWASQWPGHTFKVEKSNERLILKNQHFWKMLGTQRVNKSILWSHNYLLEVIAVIPVDTEAISFWQNTDPRVAKTIKLRQKEPVNWYVLCRSFTIKSLIWTCYCTIMFVTSWKGWTSIF